MPHTIETAPRNENVVPVEYRTFGTYDVAHWSPEAGGWVGENGEPIKFQPLRRHRFFPFFLIGTILVVAALFGVAAPVRQALPTPEARQSSENEPRQEVLVKESAEARRAVDGLNLKREAEAATAAQSLGQERETVAALARDAAAAGKELAALATELAKAREAVETQVALSSKKGGETAQLKQAAESETAELRQSLQQEHDRAEALATELAKAREAEDAEVELARRRGERAGARKEGVETQPRHRTQT